MEYQNHLEYPGKVPRAYWVLKNCVDSMNEWSRSNRYVRNRAERLPAAVQLLQEGTGQVENSFHESLLLELCIQTTWCQWSFSTICGIICFLSTPLSRNKAYLSFLRQCFVPNTGSLSWPELANGSLNPIQHMHAFTYLRQTFLNVGPNTCASLQCVSKKKKGKKERKKTLLCGIFLETDIPWY